MVTKKIGQITVKKIGKKYAACISGTPQELLNTAKLAEHVVEKLREKYGRRNYKYIKKNCKAKRRKRKRS